MFPFRRSLPPPPPISHPDDHHHPNNPPHYNYYSIRRHSHHYPSGNNGSNGSNSGLPSSDDTTTTTTIPTKIQNQYYPKIYSYKCYGKYSTASNINNNNSGGNSNSGGGKCHGMAKAIETLYNEPVRMSRIEALQRFTTMNSDMDLDDYNHYHDNNENNNNTNSSSNNSGGELSEQAVYLSPALIYQYDNDTDDDAPNESVKSNPNILLTKTIIILKNVFIGLRIRK